MTQGHSSVPPMLPDEKQHRRLIAQRLNQLSQGRMDCTTDVTLTASATTTTLIDSRIGYSSAIIPAMAMSSAGATALAAGIWVNGVQNGQATLNHASNSATTQTIRFAIIG